jgi:hypothetical protein
MRSARRFAPGLRHYRIFQPSEDEREAARSGGQEVYENVPNVAAVAFPTTDLDSVSQLWEQAQKLPVLTNSTSYTIMRF